MAATTHQDRIARCTTLAALHETLCAMESELRAEARRVTALDRDGDYIVPDLSVSERTSIAEQRMSDLVDLTDLPTYGGEAPADTTGVYSWDATHVLEYVSGTTDDGWIVSKRETPES
jgi:hypothetical protein